MQIESAHAQCDLLDSRVLSALVAPSTSAPFHSLTLKWVLRHHEVLSRHRDYVYLEATGVLRDPQDHGARVGYHLVHSVTLPSTPELAPEMQIVRGHLSYCYLFRQYSEQEVEIFFHGYMLPRGGVRDRLAFSLAAEAVLASPSTIECAMMKKLAFSLRTKQPSALRPPSPPLHQSMDMRESMSGRKSTFSVFRASGITFDSSRNSISFGGNAGFNGSACRVCHRPVRAILVSKVAHCELCEGPVCNRCRVSKKVFVFEDGVFHPQKMDFCSDCMISTNRMNAAWVASQELAGAVNRVRLSERSSSSSEDFDPKTPASLGASLRESSWNGGMSRIDESRATMSSDAPMSSSEPHSVVWLPTDHLHARLTTVDIEIGEEDPSLEENDEDEFIYDDDSFVDTEAFVTLDDDDDRFDEDDVIPMIDIPSEGEDDEFESEHTLAQHAVDLVLSRSHDPERRTHPELARCRTLHFEERHHAVRHLITQQQYLLPSLWRREFQLLNRSPFEHAGAGSSAKPHGSSKLRASRVRRQRDRERSLDEDELEQRFGSASLSLSAPIFVPASQRSASTTPSPAVTNTPSRSMAFVTDRSPSRRVAVTPQRRTRLSATAEAAAKLHKKSETQPKPQAPQTQPNTQTLQTQPNARNSKPQNKPRRQRMGTKGLNHQQPKPSAKAAAVSAHEIHRRKLSLTSTELQTPQETQSTAGTADSGAGSDSEDEVYPETAGSAFPQQLTLFSQQKRVPQRVASRDDVIDTIFKALFTHSEGRRNRPRQALSAFGDDTGTDTDEPNEEFVKRGLANALFKDQLNLHAPSSLPTAATPAAAADSLITPIFIHALVNALRFEDFRTASARLDIVRAIHKSCPTKRLHLTRALADATALRIEYVSAVAARAHKLGVEKTSSQVIVDNMHDHGHGFTELLRYSIEHVEDSLTNTPAPEGSEAARQQEKQQKELVRNCVASLVSLWRAHWVDPAGSDDEELISCAGQFAAYMPSVTGPLLLRLLSAWPSRYPKQEVGAIRMVARVIMSGPPLHQVDSTQILQRRVFARLARAVQCPNVDVAKEALAFTGCQFVLVHFLGRDEGIYKAVTSALNTNVENHWHEGVRRTSEGNFDRALNFAS
ncbi:hypothetical protein BBJ29_004504 [Phytophthora kernoviae]|uniref:FYVE-type domain-containing protein n=1 Tax=Phytophthora kernoviae TaxID=325452 RepID=A0A3R7JMT8_9STRA|nr:hypothetical protein BBJ29_004504 [Phytophthora kernoviae]